jgi:hypothetical protein
MRVEWIWCAGCQRRVEPGTRGLRADGHIISLWHWLTAHWFTVCAAGAVLRAKDGDYL